MKNITRREFKSLTRACASWSQGQSPTHARAPTSAWVEPIPSRDAHGSTLTTVPTNGPLPVSSSQENFATHTRDTCGTVISIANVAVSPASRRPMA